MPNRFKRSLVISGSVILGSVAIFAVAMYFLSQNLQNESEKIAAERIIISGRTAVLDSLASLKTNKAQADVYANAMNEILVMQDRLIDFPRWIDGLARGRNVASSFSFSGDVVQPGASNPGYANFSLSASGAVGDVIDFLKDVEFRVPRFLVDFTNIDFSGSGSNYRVSLSGKVFFK